jgi:hypothetical protein
MDDGAVVGVTASIGNKNNESQLFEVVINAKTGTRDARPTSWFAAR